MKRELTFRLTSLIFAFGGMLTNIAVAANWYPIGIKGTAPYLDPAAIQVGLGLFYANSSTITVVQGDTVTLRATSKDKDTKEEYDGASCSYIYTGVWDTSDVIWSSNGGGLPDPLRRSSGATITFTAPTLGPSEDSRTIKITATPDDNTTAAPGNRPAGDTGNRNDDPGSGVYIYFKVIKNCPTDASLGSSCSPTFAWMFAQGTKTAGFKTVQVQVSGGTPPNPPNNWNGIFIKETITLHPTDPGTAVDADFDVANYRNNFCAASVQGFVVYTSQGPYDGCPRAAATNKFWDDHWTFSTIPVLKEGKPDKTVNCRQKYFCKTTQLDTGAPNKAIKKSGSFHESTYDPDGGGPLDPYRVTEVTYTLTAE